MKVLQLTVIGIVFFMQTNAQSSGRFTISGYVKEAISSESLIGVNVYLPDRKIGTVTNNFGFYSLTLPAVDSITLIISYVGFNPEMRKISLRRNQELNIELTSNTVLKEVTVTTDRKERQSESVKMSVINVPVSQIKNVPSLLGEKDVLKVLQLMPGVQKGSEGSSGLYVRGGAADQNLIILDDAIVYNASHLFGFFSIFNGDALKSVELTKGGFPARYGGRLSSVVEMNMKEGNKEEWHGEGGIGLISSRLTVEGPLQKNKSSILLSGRRTYIDLVSKPFMGKDKSGYFFYDMNAKINYDFGRKNKLYLSGYFGNDKFSMVNNADFRNENFSLFWGNSTGTVRWNHLFNNKLFANTSVIYSNYKFGITDRYNAVLDNKSYYAEYNSGIRDLTLKYDLDFLPNPNHWIKIGVVSIFHRFNPYAYVEEDTLNNIHKKDVKYTTGIESGIYVEDTWQPFQSLKMNGGLRLSHFLATKNQYFNLEPRLSVAWRLKNDVAIKASYANMNQYIHMLSNTGISLPTDLWVPTTDRVHPQQSQQVALGFVKDFSKPEFSMSVEGYYKKMNSVIAYKEGATFLELGDVESAADKTWEDNITTGRAWSYGLEFLLQKKEGRLNGWIGYTLSWTQMQFDSINFGRKFYARYDRRHDISVVAIYKLTPRITLSGTWVYGTGNAITLPVSEYNTIKFDINNYKNPYSGSMNGIPIFAFNERVKEYGNKNDFRMASYQRLDLGIQFHKQKRWGERTWEISVYNAYNRKNPFFYYSAYTWDEKTHKTYGLLKQVTLFPIIPSITYSFKF